MAEISLPGMNTSLLIIGANGYVGAKLYVDLKEHYPTTGTYHHTPLFPELIHLDITNPKEIHDVCTKHMPTVIIHVANHANPRWCEAHPEETKLVNEMATAWLVEEANNIHAKFIYISGMVARLNNNNYALSKSASNKIVASTADDYVILEPHTVIGLSPNETNDRMMNRFLKNLDAGVAADYDTSWHFQPTYLHHISQVIAEIVKQDIRNDSIPVLTSDLKTRYDLAHDIFGPLGLVTRPAALETDRPPTTETTDKLKKYHMPIYTYAQMVNAIQSELKTRT